MTDKEAKLCRACSEKYDTQIDKLRGRVRELEDIFSEVLSRSNRASLEQFFRDGRGRLALYFTPEQIKKLLAPKDPHG